MCAVSCTLSYIQLVFSLVLSFSLRWAHCSIVSLGCGEAEKNQDISDNERADYIQGCCHQKEDERHFDDRCIEAKYMSPCGWSSIWTARLRERCWRRSERDISHIVAITANGVCPSCAFINEPWYSLAEIIVSSSCSFSLPTANVQPWLVLRRKRGKFADTPALPFVQVSTAGDRQRLTFCLSVGAFFSPRWYNDDDTRSEQVTQERTWLRHKKAN